MADSLASVGLHPLVELPDDRVPLYLPLLLKGRDSVRASLASQGIFCPVHWPRPSSLGVPKPPSEESPLWTDEISIIIDQRYGPEDIRRIARAIEASGLDP